jgi:hypothetical protein
LAGHFIKKLPCEERGFGLPPLKRRAGRIWKEGRVLGLLLYLIYLRNAIVRGNRFIEQT